MRPPAPIPDSYWVEPGRLLAGEYPGAKDAEAARVKVAKIRAAGIDVFLDLTEEEELVPYDAHLVDSEPKIEYRRYAVPDLGIPPRPRMAKILDEVDALLAAGRRVYVHCWGGIGRTGTVVGCYLVRHGKSADEALALIDEWRQGTPDGWKCSPETNEQQAYVCSWKEPV